MDEQQKTRDERIQELLDASATEAIQGIKGPSLATQVENEEIKKEEPEEESVEGEVEESAKDKKIRIRASRLNTLEQELLANKTAREQDLQRISALEGLLAKQTPQDEVPDWWKAAWGDNEVSKRAYHDQQKIFQESLSKELDRRESARLHEEREQQERIGAIESSFDEQMESLEETLGRELTDNQRGELMDIVGEYSPQDENGRYTAYMSLDKAYQIWSKGQTKSPAKSEMARIAAAPSEGASITPQSSTERPSWGGWRKRFGDA